MLCKNTLDELLVQDVEISVDCMHVFAVDTDSGHGTDLDDPDEEPARGRR